MTRSLYLCLLLGLLAPAGFTQSPPAATRAPAAAEMRVLRDLPYVTNGLPSQRLDLYLSETAGPARPLVVFIHGGGWQGGSKNNCPARPLVAQGYAVASVEYRFSQVAKFPAQIEDCKAAIRWLRAHAKEHGIDPERIGVWGASAGGHLVALLGTTGHVRDFDVGENLSESSKVQCVIDWFGPSDFVRWGDSTGGGLEKAGNAVAGLLGGTPAEKPELARKASPADYVQKDAAPFLILHGDQDRLVPLQQSTVLHEKLKAAGAESTLKVLSGSGHGGPAFTNAESLAAMGEFLNRHLRGK